ncbi:flagellar assembly protein FliH [Pseudohongiella acticola]|jgi:flagellar assembly protein FliH|uniref:flagellar assembly protein FliH n=1 Tax=Pseudohongiella acticola TaxID=1524254 RepID=UPI0030ECCC20
MMQRHVFDGSTRVSQKSLEEVPVMRWVPPTIGAGGKLIQAEPRLDSPLRQAVGQTASASDETDSPNTPARAGSTAVDSAESYDKAREEGLLSGRQEGLEKGLEEGRRQGQERGLQQGLEEGRKQGADQGYKEGLQKADAELRQTLKTLNGILTQLSHAVNEQDYQLEKALLDLSREIARNVVQRELMIDSSHIMKIVRQALATLPPSRDNVRILVNPADQPLVQQAADEGGENWRVVANQHIGRGGCRVETDQSAVDFTTSERFSQVIEQIVQRQFADDDAASDVPAGENFEEAPEPVVKAARETRPASEKRSLAEEAAAISDADTATESPENSQSATPGDEGKS